MQAQGPCRKARSINPFIHDSQVNDWQVKSEAQAQSYLVRACIIIMINNKCTTCQRLEQDSLFYSRKSSLWAACVADSCVYDIGHRGRVFAFDTKRGAGRQTSINYNQFFPAARSPDNGGHAQSHWQAYAYLPVLIHLNKKNYASIRPREDHARKEAKEVTRTRNSEMNLLL